MEAAGNHPILKEAQGKKEKADFLCGPVALSRAQKWGRAKDTEALGSTRYDTNRKGEVALIQRYAMPGLHLGLRIESNGRRCKIDFSGQRRCRVAFGGQRGYGG